VTSSNCPSASGFVSYATVPLGAAEEVVTPGAQMNLVYEIVFPILALVLLVILVIVLRSKARSRGQSVGAYVRESVYEKQPSEKAAPVALETTSSQPQLEASVRLDTAQMKSDAPMTADPPMTDAQTETPLTTTQEWEQRKDENNGGTYYYNKMTGASQWENPETV